MEKTTRIGLDTSKSVFQLHGVNEAEQAVLPRSMASFWRSIAATR